MKILACGDREWTDRGKIGQLWTLYSVQAGWQVTLIHGDCRGADRLAGEEGYKQGWRVIACPADWEKHGRAAGPVRNIQMLDMRPDLVVAFHSDLSKSKGTAHTVREAKKRGIPVEIVT